MLSYKLQRQSVITLLGLSFLCILPTVAALTVRMIALALARYLLLRRSYLRRFRCLTWTTRFEIFLKVMIVFDISSLTS